MNRELRFLRRQVEVWSRDGLISAEQAARIRGLYPEEEAGLPWAMIVFSGLGAVIVGLGAILLLAYNWQALPRAAKLGVIFLALAGAHGAGLWRLQAGGRLRGLGEVLCLLGTMLFGAAIWLIAQIYHIEEHFPNGFLFWGLGALTLAWALPSTLQGLLAAVVLAIWNASEAAGFDAPIFWAPLFIVAATGSLAWRQRSVLLLFITLAGGVVATLFNMGTAGGVIVVCTALSHAALFLAVGTWARKMGWFAEAAWVWTALGWAQFLLPAYLLGFPSLAYELLGGHAYREAGRSVIWFACLWTPLILALSAWAVVMVRWTPDAGGKRGAGWTYEEWLTPLAAVVGVMLAFIPLQREEWMAPGMFNLLFLLLAVAWMARGCREGRLGPALAGAAMLVALATARYFDLFESLAERGLVFLLVGAGLFATGMQYARAKKRLETQPEAAP